MKTVILAAGHSRRFKEAGWPKHKMLLPAPNHATILEMLVSRLDPPTLDIVALADHRKELTPTLFRVARKINFNLNVHWLTIKPKGPLDCMWAARKHLGTNESLLISYCDIMPGVDLAKLYTDTARELKWTASVAGVDNPDPRMSRVPGTHYADAGLYYFSSQKEFLKHAKKLRKGPEDGIPKVVYAHDDWHCYHTPHIEDLGVPQDYKYWAGKNGLTTEDFGF